MKQTEMTKNFKKYISELLKNKNISYDKLQDTFFFVLLQDLHTNLNISADEGSRCSRFNITKLYASHRKAINDIYLLIILLSRDADNDHTTKYLHDLLGLLNKLNNKKLKNCFS